MGDGLNLYENVNFDDRITKYQLHSYQPYGSQKFDYSDEIRITIQDQNLLTLPSESILAIEGKYTVTDESKIYAFTNNFPSFLFSEIRYELNGQLLDLNMNPGITSTMKGYVSYNQNESTALSVAGWSILDGVQNVDTTKKTFVALIPLKHLFGFAEDCQKLIPNARHDLILIRARNDVNCYKGTTAIAIELVKLNWKMPHVLINDTLKLKLLSNIGKNIPIQIAFRKWELYELPALRATRDDVWLVKTTSQLEKPRYILIGFQSKPKNDPTIHATDFDHVNISNIKLYLNSQTYPYENMGLDWSKQNYAVAYQDYVNFQRSYYDRPPTPLLTYTQYKTTPIFVIDCSKQEELLNTSTVDVKLEFEANEDLKTSMRAYCLILHDVVVEYKPLTGEVQKL